MGDDDPHHNTSCSGSTSGASSSSPSLPPAVVTPLPPPAPPPFPSAGPIPTAIAFPQQQPPLQPPPPQQQLLQQYQLQQLQQQQQQRVFSFHLSSAAVASTSPSTPASLPLKHPLPLLSPSPSPAPAFASAAPADRHARDDYWSEAATFTLIQAWGDCYLELNRGNLKQKHWRDVADAVNRRADASKAPKTDIQCKNRIDTLKKKYKLEKSKTVIVGPRKWTFFERLDELIGASKKPKKPMPVKARPSVPLLPAPAAISLPAKRSLEDTDQGPPQFHPPFGPASANYCPPSAANQVTPSHTGRTPNHAITGSNHVVSAPYHTTIVPYNAGNSPHHVGNARNQFASNTNHVASAVDATSKSKEGPDTEDSSPNGESAHLKRPKRKWPYADPMHDLAQAITKFGEVYERTEIARQQMSAEIEKQRMIFAKDLELQRLQFFTQTQLELAKVRAKFKRGQAENDS